MKKCLIILLVLMLCTVAACAESETETPTDLASYIGKPFDELMELFQESRWQKIGWEDGNTIYLSVGDITYALTVRTCIDEYPDYGWKADTVFYLTTTVEEYSLAGFRIGDYLPDIDARLTSDGWTEMAEANEYADVSYEKTYNDVKYMLDFISSYAEFEEEYQHVNCITLQGIYLGEPQKDGMLDGLFG